MAASLRSHALRSPSRAGGGADEADPMASVANLADVMLVFACGLMMALVTYWNIDVRAFSELEADRMQAIENPEQLPQEMTAVGSSYIERGTVYQDPTTGKFYLLAQDATEIDADLAANGAQTTAPTVGGNVNTEGLTSSAPAPDRASGAD